MFYGTLLNARPTMENQQRSACAPPSSHLLSSLYQVLDFNSLHKYFWLHDGCTHFQVFKLTLEKLLSHWSIQQTLTEQVSVKQRKNLVTFSYLPALSLNHWNRGKGPQQNLLVIESCWFYLVFWDFWVIENWWMICLISFPSTEIKLQIRTYYNLFFLTMKYINCYFNILLRTISAKYEYWFYLGLIKWIF